VPNIFEFELSSCFLNGTVGETPAYIFFVFQLNERIDCQCTKEGGEGEKEEEKKKSTGQPGPKEKKTSRDGNCFATMLKGFVFSHWRPSHL